MSDRTFGRAVGGLITAVLIVLAIKYGITLPSSWTVTAYSLAAIPAVVVGIAVALVVADRQTRYIGGRRIEARTGPGHGTRFAARHEGGHIAVTRAVGGRVHSAQLFPDGSGVTYLTLPRGATVAEQVAVDVAGSVATGSSWGCSSDFDYMRQALATLPPAERSAAKSEGYAIARRTCNGFLSDGGVGASARKLYEDGHL
jgi:hypothetical protein